MSIERTYHCDGPDCKHHWSDAANTQAPGLLTVAESHQLEDLHFCGWDCLLKHAAQFPPPETIPFGDNDEPCSDA